MEDLTSKKDGDILETYVAQHMLLIKRGDNMPPECKFSKEEIVAAALELVRKSGDQAVSARAVGALLGASSKVIFSAFSGMEELKQAVVQAAGQLQRQFTEEYAKKSGFPPYKSIGMAYILFAREEKELFRLLYMRDRTGENREEELDSIAGILDLLMNQLGIDRDRALALHAEMWAYVHGIAVLLATGYETWDEEWISRMLTDGFTGLRIRHSQEGAQS